MKKPQWITLFISIIAVVFIYFIGRTTPEKKHSPQESTQHSPDDGHDHGTPTGFSTDSILLLAKKQLNTDQSVRINTLENSITRGALKDQQIHVYHQLARYWADSVGLFEPYAWYTAEAARLENSEKTLTFAARLFLENLQDDEIAGRRQWKALQAKDLFERSLKLNPGNDSATVGLGACYMFGNISSSPMEGIAKIRQVVEKDSANLYAQMMLVKGSLISGQYDKAVNRLQTINRLDPENTEALLLLADTYERTGNKEEAVKWYRKSLQHIRQAGIKEAVEKRIEELGK